MAQGEVVVVTGSSSGLGLKAASLLAREGFRVYGGDLRPAPEGASDGWTSLSLDVRDDDSVAAFYSTVLEKDGRVDALVNNAGYALGGAVEETSLDEARAQFETNFFGVARMIRFVLPIMRGRRSGRIVNVSSGAGLTAGPYYGFYTASKFAVEGYTEALRHELNPFDISVSLIEPGSFKTSVVRNSRRVENPIEAYRAPMETVAAAVAGFCEGGADPILVARAIHRVLRARNPPLRTRVGKDVKWGYFLRRVLPEALFQPLVARHYKLHTTE